MNYGFNDFASELLAADIENQQAEDILDNVEREDFYHEVEEVDVRAPLYIFDVVVNAPIKDLGGKMPFASEEAVKEWIKSVHREGLTIDAIKLKKIEFVPKTVYDLVETAA